MKNEDLFHQGQLGGREFHRRLLSRLSARLWGWSGSALFRISRLLKQAKSLTTMMEIRSYLLVADKNARASVEGLNQRFLICKENGRSRVRVREGPTRELLGTPILIRIPVDEIAETIYAGKDGSKRDWCMVSPCGLNSRDALGIVATLKKSLDPIGDTLQAGVAQSARVMGSVQSGKPQEVAA